MKLKCTLPFTPALPELVGAQGGQAGSTLGSPSALRQGRFLVGSGQGDRLLTASRMDTEFPPETYPHRPAPLPAPQTSGLAQPGRYHDPLLFPLGPPAGRGPQIEPLLRMGKTEVSNNQLSLGCLGSSPVTAAPWENSNRPELGSKPHGALTLSEPAPLFVKWGRCYFSA